MAYINDYLKIIREIITGRSVRDAPSVLILGAQFVLAFINVDGHVGDGGSVHYVRVCVLQVAAGRYHELPVHFIQINVGVLADRPCCAELGHSLPVLFAILQLLLNLLRSRLFAFLRREPGRQFIRAIITQIAAVRQLFTFQHTHFCTAYRAFFLYQ